MSTILVNTLTGTSTAGSIAVTGEGNSTTTNLQNGLAKMWGNFDPNTSNNIVNSLNVASLSDNGTGDYSLNATNNFDDGFFVRLAGTTKGGGGPSSTNYTSGFSSESTSSSTLGVITVGNGGGSGPSAIELDQCFGLGHGELA
tara:strand:- start:428 stop:856 length:429 start_codon:yes stop_codon:yes gene_type:complete